MTIDEYIETFEEYIKPDSNYILCITKSNKIASCEKCPLKTQCSKIPYTGVSSKDIYLTIIKKKNIMKNYIISYKLSKIKKHLI